MHIFQAAVNGLLPLKGGTGVGFRSPGKVDSQNNENPPLIDSKEGVVEYGVSVREQKSGSTMGISIYGAHILRSREMYESLYSFVDSCIFIACDWKK
ncbi:hypothetical protein JTB14_013553 [Gonioctena quinquepunctata]|nr:hypothetical protein JTB14_013553 [Gonioctena quinquepunctata]